eukprot:1547004-Pleurochrysis_carterae.AAC.1
MSAHAYRLASRRVNVQRSVQELLEDGRALLPVGANVDNVEQLHFVERGDIAKFNTKVRQVAPDSNQERFGTRCHEACLEVGQPVVRRENTPPRRQEPRALVAFLLQPAFLLDGQGQLRKHRAQAAAPAVHERRLPKFELVVGIWEVELQRPTTSSNVGRADLSCISHAQFEVLKRRDKPFDADLA